MAEDNMTLGYLMGQSENKNDGGMFGGSNGIWVLLIFLLLLGGGFGFGGNNREASGFAWQNMENGIRGIQQGICDSTFALNNTIVNGFHGVDNAVCNLGYNTQSGFNTLSHQLSDCCCTTQRAIDGVNYNMAKGFCDLGNVVQSGIRDVMEGQAANTREILNFLTQDKIATLQAENQALKFAASQANQNAFITANQEAQTAELIRRIAPMPVPAYSVPAPYPYGYNGCGCGV